MGSNDAGLIGKSLDDIIADRRKEQAKAGKAKPRTSARDKKNAIADRSVATGRAKRAAATRARRSLNNNNADKKPSAVEVEKEVYRQTRKTAVAKKKSESKATNGRLPPNSSLREKKGAKKSNKSNNSGNANVNGTSGVLVARLPKQNQIKAAIRGMEESGCPVPDGFQLIMQFAPIEEKGKGKGKGKQPNANTNSKRNANQKNGSRRKGGRKN